jgi:hypothetical protein
MRSNHDGSTVDVACVNLLARHEAAKAFALIDGRPFASGA